jgi:hypothetical protein
MFATQIGELIPKLPWPENFHAISTGLADQVIEVHIKKLNDGS